VIGIAVVGIAVVGVARRLILVSVEFLSEAVTAHVTASTGAFLSISMAL
jgi:hypothetical protein